MILELLMLYSFAHAENNPSVVLKNNEAVKLYKNEKILDSKVSLEKEVVNHADSGALHYNLGVAHENSKEPEKALQEYVSAARIAEDKEVKFQANFNAARVYGEQKDIPNALKYYQAALEIKPDSQEAKNNIEMLFQANGGGGNSSEQNKDSNQQDKDDKNKNQQQQQQPQQQKDQQKKPAPKPFKSQDLSEQDVKRILDELKRQEEQIRAKMNNQKSKETPVDKDW